MMKSAVLLTALLVPATAFQIQPSFLQRVSLTSLNLQPVEDPNAKLNSKSLAGVVYSDVLDGLDRLYPPSDYAQRNAVSRSGGYWPYIKDGEEPPLELTYGEFDLPFFAEIVDKAVTFVGDGGSTTSWDGKTFCDIGSGTGRLVVSAAALHPGLRLCRGVEFLSTCHDYGVNIVEKCNNNLKVADDRALPMAPIELTNGSIGDPDTFVGDVDVFFISSSAMPSEVLEMISLAVGKQCKPGTIVVSTDYEIPTEGVIDGKQYRLELLETMDGYCWIVGGTSTAYFYKVVQSCTEEQLLF